MKIFVQVKDGRVNGWGSTRGNATDIEMDIPSNHEMIKNPFVFTYQNGQFTKDENYQQQLVNEQEKQDNKPSIEEQLQLLQKAIDDLILGVL